MKRFAGALFGGSLTWLTPALQPGQRSPPPLRIEPWHDSDSSSGFLGRGGGDRGSRDSMSTDGGGSFSSARSFNSTWSGSEGGSAQSPHAQQL